MATNDPYGPLILTAAQQAGVDPYVLRGLLQSESSMDPGAISKDKNGNPIAYGIAQFTPETAQQMGVKDPMDPAQAIPGAARLLRQNLDNNNGNVAQAIATYKAGSDRSGWGPITVSGTQKAIGYADQARGAAAASADPVLGFMSQQSKSATPATSAPAQGSAQQPTGNDPVLAFMNGQQPAQSAAQQPGSQQTTNTTQQPTTARQNAAQSMGLDPISSAVNAAAVRGLSGLAGGVAGLGAGALKALTTGGDWAAANQAWNQTAGKVGGAIESALTPAGNATAQGVGQAVANVPGEVIGAGVNAGANAVGAGAQGLGASPETARKISELTKFGANAALTVAGVRGMTRGVPESATAPAAGEAATAAPEATAAPQPGAQPAQPAPGMGATPKPRYRPNGDGTFSQVSPTQAAPQAPATQAPAAAPTNVPTAPPSAPVNPVPIASLPAVSGKSSELFPLPDKTPTVAGPLPAAAQAQNRAVINALGLDSVRDSVITGDAKQSGIEYENAKDGGPIGDVMSRTIAGEQNAIRNYAQSINDMTGRDPSLDPEGVGRKILAPFQKIGDWFDQQAGNLYTQARQAAGNVPLAETPSLTAKLGDLDLRDRMSASPDGQAVYNAVQSRFARFTGLADQAGEEGAAAAPARTVDNAENFRQWLNAVGRDLPQFGNFIGQVKQALDTDVAAAGGRYLFNQARTMWAQRQQMLSDPAQLAKVIGDGDGDLNRSIPLDKVGQRVVGMDTPNFRNTLSSLTKIEQLAPELAPDVQGALAEIRGQAAKQLTDAGGKNQYWNANQFSTTAQGMAPKLKLVFNNNEMGALRTLNEAGRVIRQPGPYPGAAAQHGNFFRSGIATALPYVANAAGHAVGGTVGGFAGQLGGNRLASLVRSSGESAAATKLAKRYRTNVSP